MTTSDPSKPVQMDIHKRALVVSAKPTLKNPPPGSSGLRHSEPPSLSSPDKSAPHQPQHHYRRGPGSTLYLAPSCSKCLPRRSTKGCPLGYDAPMPASPSLTLPPGRGLSSLCHQRDTQQLFFSRKACHLLGFPRPISTTAKLWTSRVACSMSPSTSRHRLFCPAPSCASAPQPPASSACNPRQHDSGLRPRLPTAGWQRYHACGPSRPDVDHPLYMHNPEPLHPGLPGTQYLGQGRGGLLCLAWSLGRFHIWRYSPHRWF